MGIGVAGLVLASHATQDVVANGDTRTLTLHHAHRNEDLTVTFKRWGQYDSGALQQLNVFLRDWRNDAQTRMDPRLFDVLWSVLRQTGSNGPVHVLSAYRSPGTNAMLRRRSSGVAKHSQHINGKAMDFRVMDVSMRQVREVAMQLERGGVGFYPSAHTPFVHLDVGSVRSWPRMTRDQLARLFPDGKTVHLPAGGGMMPGYEQARAEIVARGGTVAGYSTYAEGEAPSGFGRGKSLWATLFGGGEDEEEEIAAATGRRAPLRRGRAGSQPRVAAAAPAPVTAYSSEDAGTRGVFMVAQAQVPAPPQPPSGKIAIQAPRPAAPPIEEAKPAPVALPAPPSAGRPPPADRLEQAAKPTDIKPEAPANARRLVAVPAPPARPAGLGLEQKPTLVAMPVPPARPGAEVAALVTEPPADGAEQPKQPADRPGQPQLLAYAHPAPPERPDLPTIVTRGIALAPAREPAKLSKPTISAADRLELKRILIAPSATPVATPSTPVRTAKTRAQQAAATVLSSPPVIRMAFGQEVDTDLVTGSFSGPAVKALPALAANR